ncbi:MAG: FGGY-family carbohydrate kinase [Candidatus Limiplasma sp.]|nr:FGGY-family carbohydrate kinase [Candidatus Limiplasma sp.]
MENQGRNVITAGDATLGIELGSTRIKMVLIDQSGAALASGAHAWENQYRNGVWTYALQDVWDGLRNCYGQLAGEVRRQYGVELKRPSAIGVSAMMHGYLPLDREENQLAEFRTWRNLRTEAASQQLTELFGFPIPQRWSIAHLYQAMLNREAHVPGIAHLATLAGYVHWKLTGERVVGVGEASGMFPIGGEGRTYDAAMLASFNALAAQRGMPWRLEDLLPRVALAGEEAGCLTQEGALLLDPSGTLLAGAPFCPPEGDAQTGMVATNSVAARTGNVSAGTSVFGMVVMEKELPRLIPQVEIITTPTGKPVAMVHCNNCTTDLNAWTHLFYELADMLGVNIEMGELFSKLFYKSLEGEMDGGGLLAYNYDSGENITGLMEGRPLLARMPTSRFTLANFMRVHLYSALATLKAGFDLLLGDGGVRMDRVYAHGGFFKTEGVGQGVLASALKTPVTVLRTATEGGAWGIALLAAYLRHASAQPLESWLEEAVFKGHSGKTMAPDTEMAEGFERFHKRYMKGLAIEKAAVECFGEERA